jgi:peptide/nickel transport system substrate-binding protein
MTRSLGAPPAGSAVRFALASTLLLAAPALAGGRPRFGGTLSISLVAKAVEPRPLYADAPTDAVALALTHAPLCRLVEVGEPAGGALPLTLRAGVEAAEVTAALQRVAGSSTPYRALLTGVAGWKVAARSIELTLTGATADLPRALCHPAFSIAAGPFRGAEPLTANADAAEGRPYLDVVHVTAADAREAERLFAQRRSGLLVGGAARADDAPQLFVTLLVLPAPLAPHLAPAIASTIDREDLVRFFLRPPAAPLTSLLPTALGGPGAAPAAPQRPPPLAPAREIAVTWDEGNALERAIAERLQVKLQPLGYRVALKAQARALVRARPPDAAEVTLQSLLLPASPTAALAVLLEAAGQRARIGPALAAISTAKDPDARAREFAVELLPQLPLVPLATRGVAVSAAKDVRHLTRDALGLPRLDDVFLAPE